MKKSRRHALGQHVLASPGILDRIVAAASPAPGETVLEIGAGKGVLTRALAAAGARVLAVEIDSALAASLRYAPPPGTSVMEGDILRLDWTAVLQSHGAGPGPYLIVGNLPYSISSPLLYMVLDYREAIRKAVFLVQREVAERLVAGPGSKDYAPLGILLQIYFQAKILFKVAPGSFVPPPKVESAVVGLERRDQPLFEVGDYDRFRRFLHVCFAARRKTLANNLAAAGYPRNRVSIVLDGSGLPPKARAEAVPLPLWPLLLEPLRRP